MVTHHAMTTELETDSLAKAYDPAVVEGTWFERWKAWGVFDADPTRNPERPAYHVPMPPPNVTGSLHMGHAMFGTLQDALVRYHRMRGFETLYQPGMDHAGIATQTVVERQLARDGKTRHDLGREAFLERVWAWKAESGGRIEEQLRVLGTSASWSRAKFTMDADMSHAVRTAFVQLWNEGLIYRATRLVHWDPVQMTSLSDLEVDFEEGASGELFSFAYKIEGSDEEIVVATTRPETMLGDTGVAVHPKDERYTHLHGKYVVHPFNGRRIPIVCDDVLVDMAFGTGAVKVTPAHDFNDFATGKRHNLEEINIFELDGKVNAVGGKFAGLDRFVARKEIKKALEELGLTRGAQKHVLRLPKSSRSGAIVEPMISTQWYVKMKGMADQALDFVRSGQTQILPETWQKTYEHFLDNIQDWCISRQLWWGHRIPAWHGPNGEIRVGMERPAECGEGWSEDPDVLDTWFSSALWPFSTLGWPEKTPWLDRFYPASDLETGYDILFFWVARMMMFGGHFMGKAPFKRILLHGLIVDETGEKMSKVKGNVIDPLDLVYGASFSDVVKKTMPGAPEAEALAKFKKAYPSASQLGTSFPAFGTDAVRYALATYAPSNTRIALAPKRIEGYRFFLNKIWNATRFSLDIIGDKPVEWTRAKEPKLLVSKWVLAKLDAVVAAVHEGFGAFRIDEAATALYRFFWYDFCDWYLELSKPILREERFSNDEREETRAVLATIVEASLRLIHPLAPFATEELWQRVPKADASPLCCALARYPEVGDYVHDASAEKSFDLVRDVISAARAIRTEHEVHPAAAMPLLLRSEAAEVRALIEENDWAIRFLAKTEGAATVGSSDLARPPASSMRVVASQQGAVDVLVSLKGLVTPEKEKARAEREKKRIEKDLAAVEKKLGSPNFTDRAPKEVVEEAHEQLRSLKDAMARLLASATLTDEL